MKGFIGLTVNEVVVMTIGRSNVPKFEILLTLLLLTKDLTSKLARGSYAKMPSLTDCSKWWTMYGKVGRELTTLEMKMSPKSFGVTKLDLIQSQHIRGT